MRSYPANQVAKNISLWAWICGARLYNSTVQDVINMYESKLISDSDARRMLNVQNSDYEVISDDSTHETI